jgi:hypothetical protein
MLCFSSRLSAARKQQDHVLGEIIEDNRQDTVFAELAATLDDIARQVTSCRDCDLCRTRKRAVPDPQ